MTPKLLIIPLSALLASMGLNAEPSTLLNIDFNDPAQPATARLLEHPKIELIEAAGQDGSNAIRVNYIGGSMGSERVVTHIPFPHKTDYAKLDFDVRFEDGWQFVRGGKLHGVGPDKPVTGGRERRPDGWSSRIMWGKEGFASTYLYDQSEGHKYGVGDRTTEPVFKIGQWQHVTIVTQLNDAGQSNGYTQLYVDGNLVADSQNMEFRGQDSDDTLISRFLFSTFHGGNDPSWAPQDADGSYVDVTALFDNITVTTR